MNVIIHPEDQTTVFLKSVYEQVEDKTVVEKDSSPDEIKAFMSKSDRTMIMGHGSPQGLPHPGSPDSIRWIMPKKAKYWK